MDTETKMAWRNIWRNPRRSILTLLAIALSCVFLIFMASFQNGSYQQMIETTAGATTGEVQILVEGFDENPDIRDAVRNPDPIIAEIQGIPAVETVMKQAETYALVSSETESRGVMIVGIDAETARSMASFTNTIRSGSYFTGEGRETLVGSRLADALEVETGDELVLLGQGRDGSVAADVLTVRGIFESGFAEADRNMIRIPLDLFQETFFMDGAVHRIVVNSSGFSETEALRGRVQAEVEAMGLQYAVRSWEQLLPGLKQSIELDMISGAIIYVFLLVVVAFSIMNTFLMAILERTREFGVILAIGTSRRRLFRLLFKETGMLATVGVALGIALGVGVTAIFQSTGIDFGEAGAFMEQFGMPSRLFPRMNPFTVLSGPAFVYSFTFLSALYPIWRVRSLHPVEAMQAA